MIIRINEEQRAEDPSLVINLRCPACNHRGTFENVKIQDLTQRIYLTDSKTWQHYRLGQRRCPNPDCQAHIFFIYDATARKLATSYPGERIDFDSTNLPSTILKSLEEAITCHANQCFVASAIMVRKALEELCRDREAKGANLKERLKHLQTKVILPQELLDGLDDLRLLGNDAAHIESQHYNNIGQEEIEIALEVTKEVLKAVYQYSSLINKLKSLKKSS